MKKGKIKEQSTIYVGNDVSKDTLTVATVCGVRRKAALSLDNPLQHRQASEEAFQRGDVSAY